MRHHLARIWDRLTRSHVFFLVWHLLAMACYFGVARLASQYLPS